MGVHGILQVGYGLSIKNKKIFFFFERHLRKSE